MAVPSKRLSRLASSYLTCLIVAHGWLPAGCAINAGETALRRESSPRIGMSYWIYPTGSSRPPVFLGHVGELGLEKGVGGAVVHLSGEDDFSAMTDADGRFSIVAAEGVYDLSINFVGDYPLLVQEIRVAAGDSVSVEAIMMPGAVLYEQPN